MEDANSTLQPTAENILTGESTVITNEDASVIDIVPKDSNTPMDNTMRLLSRMVKPHEKISREVTEADLPKIMEDAYILRDLCIVRNGAYASAYALAHSQIDDQDPLRFFVFQDGRVIINPRIINRTKHLVDSDEGCMTYPEKHMVTVGRSHKIVAEYQTLIQDGEKQALSPVVEGSFSGRESKIFQHEIDHMDGKYIYPKESTLEETVKDENNG
jgi:peptide deformylase